MKSNKENKGKRVQGLSLKWDKIYFSKIFYFNDSGAAKWGPSQKLELSLYVALEQKKIIFSF